MFRINFKTSKEILLDPVKESFTDIVEKIKDVRDEIGVKLFQETVEKLQLKTLDRYLGKKYKLKKRRLQLKIPWSCPCCGNTDHFVRRGKRSKKRKIISSLGQVSFDLYNVECKKCNKVFSPFLKIFGIKERVRILDEALKKMIEVVTENGYLTTRMITQLFSNISYSERSLQKKVKEKSEELKLESSGKAVVSIYDGTKVNTGKTKRGEGINVVMEIEGRCGTQKRPGMKMRIIDVQVGKQVSLKGKINTDKVICDGERGQKKLIKEANPDATTYRCHWHIPRTLGHYLYLDGIHIKEERAKIINEIKSIIYGKESHVIQKIRIKTYEKFIRIKEFKRTASYLKIGINEIFAFRSDHFKLDGKILLSQSPLERVMREIKRRSRIGSRWSSKGIESLMKLKLAKMYNKPSYAKFWSNNNNPMFSDFENVN